MNRDPSLSGLAAMAEAWAGIRALWPIILLSVVFGALVGVLYSARESERIVWVQDLIVRSPTNNATVIDLGVAAPFGPVAGELVGRDVEESLAARTGISESEIREQISIVPSMEGGDGSIIHLRYVNAQDNPVQAREFLRKWSQLVIEQRGASFERRIGRAESIIRDQISNASSETERKRLVGELDRLIVLGSSSREDTRRDGKPYQQTEGGQSPLRFVVLGGFVGGVGGLFLVLIINLLSGKLRTLRGISSRFMAPVVGAVDDDVAISKWVRVVKGDASRVAVVDGTQGRAGDEIERLEREQSLIGAGTLGQHALTLRNDDSACLVVVSPGVTSSSDVDQWLIEAEQIPNLTRVGLIASVGDVDRSRTGQEARG